MGFYSEKIFPRLLARATGIFDEERSEILKEARGRVLELGIGNGQSLSWYPDGVKRLVGIDVSEALLARCAAYADDLGRQGVTMPDLELVPASAADLPFPEASFDTVVAFLVFCSIDDPERAASEMMRVLKPGGRLLVFEHVAASDARLARWQDRFNPVWRRLACGCNLNRKTKATLEQAGFEMGTIHSFVHPESMKLTSPKIKGLVIKPTEA